MSILSESSIFMITQFFVSEDFLYLYTVNIKHCEQGDFLSDFFPGDKLLFSDLQWYFYGPHQGWKNRLGSVFFHRRSSVVIIYAYRKIYWIFKQVLCITLKNGNYLLNWLLRLAKCIFKRNIWRSKKFLNDGTEIYGTVESKIAF